LGNYLFNMALAEEFENQGNWLFKYRSYLPLFLIVAGIGMYAFTEINPHTSFSKGQWYEGYYEYLCFAVCILGLAIRVFTVGFTPKNTSGRNVHGQVAEVLNTRGIYATVRHPLYLGNFFMWLGTAMLTGHFWFILLFCLIYWIYYERIMFAEEQFLRRKFGEMYTNWAEGIPAFFPTFSQYQSTGVRFNWRKVVRNEKNGLFAIFAIFVAFELLDLWLDPSSVLNLFFLVGLIFSLIYYVVVKFLSKKTSLLED
jgi:protein-S-isoprenylcysteine O-methyltransferase Ste14